MATDPVIDLIRRGQNSADRDRKCGVHDDAVETASVKRDGGIVAYELSFFCRAGEDRGDEALDRLLDHLLESGDRLVGEWLGLFEDPVAAFRLGTGSRDGDRQVADLLTLELHVGVAEIAESVIAASPNDERGMWGCDLLATLPLSGNNPDWALTHRIWAAVVSRWGAVPWDESSGFELAARTPQL